MFCNDNYVFEHICALFGNYDIGLLQVPSGAFITDLYGKIVGKEISAKIDLSEANLNGDSNIYEAVDLWDPSAHQLGAVERTPESSSSLFIKLHIV